MAGQITISTLKDDAGVLATQNGMTGIAKAWVNFDGTGTPSIRGSYNVSSITDNGTGDYTVNFTTAMPNANYSVAGCATTDASGWGTVEVAGSGSITTMTTTALRIRTVGYAAFFDPVLVCVNILSS
jgi:hypothetical protein